MRRPPIALTLPAGLALVAALLTGCNDDGRTLAPAPSTTAPAPPTSAVLDAGDTAGATSSLSIRVPGVAEGELLDPTYTCDGEDIHPPLQIDGVPDGAAALAISVVDLDADGYVHWVVAGLAPTTTDLAAGEVPADAVAARSDGGTVGWEGPCPPADDAPHRYELTVYAVAEPIGLAPDLDGGEAIGIIQSAAIATGRYTVRYARTAG